VFQSESGVSVASIKQQANLKGYSISLASRIPLKDGVAEEVDVPTLQKPFVFHGAKE